MVLSTTPLDFADALADADDAIPRLRAPAPRSAGRLDGPAGSAEVTNVAIKGVSFRSAQAVVPGTVRHLTTDGDAGLRFEGPVRSVSCVLRRDGTYDIHAELP